MTVPFSRPGQLRFVQLAYHVRDVDEAVDRFNRMYGLGPFVMRRHVSLEGTTYRGQPSSLDISAAHAQLGEIQIELIQQHGGGQSMLRDMYAADEEGIHHAAIFPHDFQEMIDHFTKMGLEETTRLVTIERRGAAFIDARQSLGHMIEVYIVNQSLLDFYDLVADLASRWDGKDLRIELEG